MLPYIMYVIFVYLLCERIENGDWRCDLNWTLICNYTTHNNSRATCAIKRCSKKISQTIINDLELFSSFIFQPIYDNLSKNFEKQVNEIITQTGIPLF